MDIADWGILLFFVPSIEDPTYSTCIYRRENSSDFNLPSLLKQVGLFALLQNSVPLEPGCTILIVRKSSGLCLPYSERIIMVDAGSFKLARHHPQIQ